eukprot:jgi/Phyca11/129711/e_gw1.86.23.1
MMKLFCAVVGEAESVFHVDIEPGETVSDLKDAIKEINKHDPVLKNVTAMNLQLFLAKKGGAWLSGDDPAVLELEEGEIHPDILEMMDAKPMLDDKTLQFLLFEKNKLPQPSTNQIHVLVEIPAGARAIPYSNRPPKPFVSSEGATWDFQNPLDNEQLSNAIRKHYDAWKRGYYDKILHPLFTCWSGPGTGKSRLLDEFPKLLKDWLFAGKSENPDMIRLLQNAFTFNIAFDKETPHEAGSFSSAAELIGTRMLYQLQDTLKWDPFVQEKSRHSVPSDVMDKLSKILGTRHKDMCVILCVDGMEKLSHENGGKDCEFYKVLTVLSYLIGTSKCWVIAICSATIYSPVKNFLLSSPQWAYEVPTAILSRPTVEGEDIFATFNGDQLIELLIDDMGGFGRALEVLHVMMRKARRKGSLEFMSVLTAVLAELRVLYPRIKKKMASMQEAFLAVVARRPVDKYSRFGKLSLDDVISTGLVRREGRFLTCPYVLYLLLDTPDSPWSKYKCYSSQETRENAKPWQTWEAFNYKLRALKSVACQGKVDWRDIHRGARFGRGCYRVVIEEPRTYSLDVNRKTAKLDGFGEGNIFRCKYDPDQQGYFFEDAFTGVKDAESRAFHEIHQCKKIKDNLSLEDLLEEKKKAAGPHDLFLLYCTSEVEGDIESLENCAVVDRTCWEKYYGPFAARALYVSTVSPPDINTSAIQSLQLVNGIGPAISKRIVEKRPYSSLEEAHEKTGVSMNILSQTSCKRSKVDK